MARIPEEREVCEPKHTRKKRIPKNYGIEFYKLTIKDGKPVWVWSLYSTHRTASERDLVLNNLRPLVAMYRAVVKVNGTWVGQGE